MLNLKKLFKFRYLFHAFFFLGCSEAELNQAVKAGNAVGSFSSDSAKSDSAVKI